MYYQRQRYLSHILTAFGLMLLLGGVVMWRQQIHAEVIEEQEIRRVEATYAPPTWRLVQISLTATSTAYIFDYPSSTPTTVSEPIAPALEPSNTPLPTTIPTNTPLPPPTLAPTPSLTPSPTPSPQPTNPPSPTPSLAPSPTPSPSLTPTITPSPTLSLTPSLTPTITPSPTPSLTPSPTSPPSPTVPPEPLPPADTVPSRILAPAIELDSEVVEMGWQIEYDSDGKPESAWIVPEFAAGWHKNSTLPGHGGNTVLSAHNNIGSEVFRELVDLEAGDEVELEADGIRYRYVVEEKYIFKEEGEALEVRIMNNTFIEPTPDERLTLVSCWPYTTNSHRVVIIGRPLFR